VSAYRGSWTDQMTVRVPVAWALETEYFVHARLWRIAGLMLIGMSLHQWGIFSARRSPRFYRRMILGGAVVAIPLTLVGVQLNRAHQWSPDYSLFFGGQINYWASLPMAMAWTGFVMWACLRPRLAPVIAPLRAVGHGLHELHSRDRSLHHPLLWTRARAVRKGRSRRADARRAGDLGGSAGNIQRLASTVSLWPARVAVALTHLWTCPGVTPNPTRE